VNELISQTEVLIVVISADIIYDLYNIDFICTADSQSSLDGFHC